MAKTPVAGSKIEFVDLPELSETFADGIEKFTFDGNTLRVTFTITRLDETKPPAPPSGLRYPACRLVIPVTTANDLYNRLGQLVELIKQRREDQADTPV